MTVRTVAGAVLAGGAGRRMSAAGHGPGSSKPVTSLGGRPLVAYPVAALAAVCARVAIVCKRGSEVPCMEGVERWVEPDAPRHPLTGIIHALERAAGPVLVCAADMPFVTADGCRTLLEAVPDGDGGDSEHPRGRDGPSAVIAVREDRELEPLLAVYLPSALPSLAAAPPGAPLRRTVAALDPIPVPLPARLLRSINTPEELAAAEAELGAQPA